MYFKKKHILNQLAIDSEDQEFIILALFLFQVFDQNSVNNPLHM